MDKSLCDRGVILSCEMVRNRLRASEDFLWGTFVRNSQELTALRAKQSLL